MSNHPARFALRQPRWARSLGKGVAWFNQTEKHLLVNSDIELAIFFGRPIYLSARWTSN